MSILEIGVSLSAIVFLLIAFGTVIATVVTFLYAQTLLLKSALVRFKHSNTHLHPFTQSLLDGSSPELQLAQRALKRGDKKEAKALVNEIVHLLNAENDDRIRKQLQSKLKERIQ